MRTFFLIIICGFFAGISAAQVGDPVRFDEMSDPNCETFLVRAENLFLRLRETPTDKAYVVIRGPNRLLMKKLRYEMWLRGSAESRKFDVSRISIIRAAEDGTGVRIEFWVEPLDTDYRPEEDTAWNFNLKPRGKPLEIYSQMEQICSSRGFDLVLKEFIDANPKAFIQIRVFAPSRKKFNQITSEARKELKNLPHDRLRPSWLRSLSTYAEYWIVPKR